MAANENYLFCWSKSIDPVAYSSDIFAAALPQQDPSALKAAFLAFLQKKYGYKSGPDRSVECVIEPPSVGGFRAAQMNKRYLGEYANRDKQQLVETGWRNTPAEAAANYTPAEVAATNAPIDAAAASTKAATAAAAAAYENYMVCYFRGETVTYFSDIFNAGMPPPGPRGRQGSALGQLYAAYLQKNYGLVAHGMCAGPPNPNAQNTQTYKHQLEDQTRQEGKQVIETAWKNQ